MTYQEQFSSRWGIIMAALAMAIGAGNLWRFPRLAGQYGGSFLILWILFLLIWSIPILLTEFSIGKRFHKGVIGTYAGIGGKSFTWNGGFYNRMHFIHHFLLFHSHRMGTAISGLLNQRTIQQLVWKRIVI